ncbi:sulfotransferase [Dokdonella sp.]|uniref:tetratricopeptide repeat-containing sulfotransferase family protein n=1 Tax=Dokdonella sp. TaxID=2291710 RepID=UPI0031C1539D|nr:sulfotransferase [Dokdonella sp.]
MSEQDARFPATPAAAEALRQFRLGRQKLAERDPLSAERCFAAARRAVPDDPQLLCAHALSLAALGRSGEAATALRRAAILRPRDPAILAQLGGVLADAGEHGAAEAALRQSCTLAPHSAGGWYNLGKLLQLQARLDESLAPLEQALALEPGMQSARFLLAESLMMLGRSDAAAAQYRQVLAASPLSGHAWWGLANLKAVRFGAADLAALEAACGHGELPLDERIGLGFAHAKALEDADRHADAFAAYLAANRLGRQRFPWNAAAFRAWVGAMRASFDGPVAGAPDAALGGEVIFVVSLPRSGSTLTEQILAAHPQVEGGSELTDLGMLIGEESRRRGRPFPAWVSEATPDDWQRLGKAYLARTAKWRERRPRFTDKTPGNWMLVGAIRAMLPGAHIIDCRRDPVETCLSCFRQIFWAGHEYSYDLGDLAACYHDYADTMQHWQARHPEHIRGQSYEALVADTEGETRALLEFCGLPFDPVCLRYFEAERSVRTASASQVRQPIRRDTARAPRYGALLDPLRQALKRG